MRDAKKLRQHYFSTSHWRLDILSMLPTDFLYFWWGPNQCSFDRVPCAVIVRINRLFRLPRMWEWFERTETATGYPNAFRICKVSTLEIGPIVLLKLSERENLWSCMILFIIEFDRFKGFWHRSALILETLSCSNFILILIPPLSNLYQNSLFIFSQTIFLLNGVVTLFCLQSHIYSSRMRA